MLQSAFLGTGVQGTQLTQSAANQHYDGIFGANRVPGGTAVAGSGASGKVTVDPEALKRQISLYQQYVGILGQSASVEQQIANAKMQVKAYELQPGAIKLSNEQIENLQRLAREQALGITQIKASADAYRIEADAVGMTTGQAAAYAAAQNAINEAKRAGRPLTEENIAAIQREAQALGAAAQQADDMRFRYDTFKSTFVDFGQQIRQGATAWQAFKNAGVNALGKVADKLAEMAAQNLWKSAFGGSSGVGNWFSNIFGGGASGSNVGGADASGLLIYGPGMHSGGIVGRDSTFHRYVHPAYFDDAPRFHSGGMIGADEVPIIAKKGEGVFTQSQMAAMGGSSPTINIYPVPGSTATVTQNADGSLDIVHKMIGEAIAANNKTLPDRVAAISNDPRRR